MLACHCNVSATSALMTMDSCTDEEGEEFFETLDAISVSSPSSDSEGRGDERCCQSIAVAEASVQGPQMLPSKYEIWQNHTSSILERRQRLFSKMGIRLERKDSKTEYSFLKLADGGLQQGGLSKSQREIDNGPENSSVSLLDQMDLSDIQQSTVSNGDGLLRVQAVESKTVIDRSQDTFSISDTRHATGHSRGNNSIQVDENQVLPAPSSNGHSFPASRSDYRRDIGENNGVSRSHSLQEGTFSNQVNSLRLLRSSQDFASLSEEDNNLSPKQSSLQSGVVSSDEKVVSQSMQGLDLLFRIKDLDSGKEFIVNADGKDNSWNKVKELKTGQELTLEEFQSSLGFSPIVQEVMKREEASGFSGALDAHLDIEAGTEKKRAWLKAIKGFVNSSRDQNHQGSCSNERVRSLEKSGRRSSSESNESQEFAQRVAKRMEVRAHRKNTKDFKDLYLRQEIQAHEGAIWTMKFNFDGSLLASAGQDKVVRVWEAVTYRESQPLSDVTGESLPITDGGVDNPLHCDNHLIGSAQVSASALSSLCWSSKPFLLSEKPKHVFCGHSEDILDLSWSQSQLLLSSSMDNTVRLWNVVGGVCLKIFGHNDYVTCIDFNPVDDGYFISGSLDGKVRVWSIQERQVVDWVDLCEMVTAACYRQNGQGAVAGSYKGTCYFYKTIGSKLQFDEKFQVQRKRKKRSQGKKITGFQFVPDDSEKLLITSSDSRIRVYDGSKVCSKYIGLKNSKSQISASLSSDGAFVICASEDSRVCIWKYYDSSLDSVQKQKSFSRSYEDFLVQHVSIAIPWPGSGSKLLPAKSKLDTNSETMAEEKPEVKNNFEGSLIRDEKLCDINVDTCDKLSKQMLPDSEHKSGLDSEETTLPTAASSILDTYLQDCCSVLSKAEYREQNGNCALSSERKSAGWMEGGAPSESLDRCSSHENRVAISSSEDSPHKNVLGVATAWGLVIVTAGLGGEIQIFQNIVPA